jgi:hypothetical protein
MTTKKCQQKMVSGDQNAGEFSGDIYQQSAEYFKKLVLDRGGEAGVQFAIRKIKRLIDDLQREQDDLVAARLWWLRNPDKH